MLLVQITIATFLIIAVSYFVYNYIREKQTETSSENEEPLVEERPFIEPKIKQVKPKSAPRKRPNKKKPAGNKPTVKTKK